MNPVNGPADAGSGFTHTRSFSLPKTFRLKEAAIIDQLFEKGQTFAVYPFRIFHLPSASTAPVPCRVVFPVSRKRMKRAVDRNRRLMKEAFRLHKHILLKSLENNGRSMVIAILFTGDHIPDFPEVEHKIMTALQRLSDLYESPVG
jgi:ribonuclease P protein component